MAGALASAAIVIGIGTPGVATGEQLRTAGDLVYVSQDYPNPGGMAGDIAACPSGTSVVGGGVAVAGAFDNFHVLTSSHPIDDLVDVDLVPDDGWQGQSFNYGDADAGTVFAVCMSQEHLGVSGDDAGGSVGKVNYVRRSHVLPPLAQDGGKARCPTGTTITGGGLQSAGDDRLAASSFPIDLGDGDKVADDGWKALLNNHLVMEGNLDVFAICLKQGRRPVSGDASKGSVGRLHFRRERFKVPAGARGSAKARCPGGTKDTGGGLKQRAGFSKSSEISRTRPFDGVDQGSRPDDGWLGAADNDSDSRVKAWTFAICLEQ